MENAKSKYGFVIGGYDLVCSTEFIDGLLSGLYCSTGEESSTDTTESNRAASNTEIHLALLKGFSKKFGPPSRMDNSSVSNQLGTKFDSNSAVWIDKKGNKLILNSIDTKINAGSVLLKSAQQVRKDETKSRKTEEQRNF